MTVRARYSKRSTQNGLLILKQHVEGKLLSGMLSPTSKFH